MEICCIWAQDKNGAIGKAGAIPWHIPQDFAHFKELTSGHAVIMGRKTWESLPKKPLPWRLNIVVSSSPEPFPGATSCKTVADAVALARAAGHTKAFFMGGQHIYREAMNFAAKLYVTRVELTTDGADSFAPELDATWKLALKHGPATVEGPRFQFETWIPRGERAMTPAEVLNGAFAGVEPQTDIEVGERVRSYDFAGNIHCYAEGLVLAITGPIEGCSRYEIQVDRRVLDSKEIRSFEPKVYPPVNGTPTLFGSKTNLVFRLPEGGAPPV